MCRRSMVMHMTVVCTDFVIHSPREMTPSLCKLVILSLLYIRKYFFSLWEFPRLSQKFPTTLQYIICELFIHIVSPRHIIVFSFALRFRGNQWKVLNVLMNLIAIRHSACGTSETVLRFSRNQNRYVSENDKDILKTSEY